MCLMGTGMHMDRTAHRAQCAKRMKCAGCDKTMDQLAKRISYFADHVLACGGENIYKCRNCVFQTANMPNYKKHILTCSVSERTCRSCQKVYFSAGDLKAHIDEAHPPIKCHICLAIFMTKSQVDKHIARDHASVTK